jgi:hypothetical protein
VEAVKEEPAVTAPPPPAPVEVKPADLMIRVRGLMCKPSVDGLPGRESPAPYPKLAPGKHTVYCAIDGKPVRVGDVELIPEAKVEKVIEVKDGVPRFIR